MGLRDHKVKTSQAHTLQIPKLEGFVGNMKSLMMRKSTFWDEGGGTGMCKGLIKVTRAATSKSWLKREQYVSKKFQASVFPI